MASSVVTGLERLLAEHCAPIKGARVGLLGNQATVDSRFRHAADLLHAAPEITLTMLFAPEHGFRGVLQDMETVSDEIDPYIKLPVRSLYGLTEATLRPAAEDLEPLDVLVVDLPDIGSRYYTFAQSLGYAMLTAAAVGTKVVVLDRPNPLGGVVFEGAALTKQCRSFCGYAPVANRHGLTLGELALMMQRGFGTGADAIPPIDCDLEVIRVQGWKREDYFDRTGLPWVLPSPNMPTLDTAIVYPGSCLFEGTELSEGRGTTKPLEMFGAPYIDGKAWAERVAEQGMALAGAICRPVVFSPKFQKYTDTLCGGVQLHITDRATFQPFRWSLALIAAAKQLYPDKFSWRKQPYEFLEHVPAIDLLYGSAQFRESVDSGKPAGELLGSLETFESWFAEARQPFLLY
ncbi:MAG: DUF1343 domain-containing protein [Bdellovibrionales bacterium]|nr:DUF1343 domain-containing protein [Bdellovibrionales bacterium]